MDSGIFSAVQVAGIAALEGPDRHTKNMCRLYQQRRDTLLRHLNALGLQVDYPKATFYVWLKIPRKLSSIRFARLLLDEADIVVTPGVGFGAYGEGFIRLALTVSQERIEEAVRRLKKVL